MIQYLDLVLLRGKTMVERDMYNVDATHYQYINMLIIEEGKIMKQYKSHIVTGGNHMHRSNV